MWLCMEGGTSLFPRLLLAPPTRSLLEWGGRGRDETGEGEVCCLRNHLTGGSSSPPAATHCEESGRHQHLPSSPRILVQATFVLGRGGSRPWRRWHQNYCSAYRNRAGRVKAEGCSEEEKAEGGMMPARRLYRTYEFSTEVAILLLWELRIYEG